MESKIIEKVSKDQMLTVVKNVVSPTFVNVELLTVVDMNKTNNPFYNRVTKSSKRNYLLGSEYLKRVIKNMKNEGLEPDFQVEKPKGKTHVSGSVLVSDKDPNQFYVMLELFDEIPPVTEYFLDGEPVEKQVVEGYFKPVYESKKQEQERKVKVITPKIESIRKMSILGHVYEIG